MTSAPTASDTDHLPGEPSATGRVPRARTAAGSSSPSAAGDTAARTGTFTSLHNRNFRMFAASQVVSNTGKWVQRIAQDWLVLSLTGSATDVGITTALQFLPTVLFGMTGGVIADRFNKRRVLLVTQTAAGVLSAVLAVLALSGQVTVWHVYLVAFGLGVVTAVDNPTRQSFVNELVGPAQLRNAISLNSSVFQLGALVGPAVSGLLINAVGVGYSFAGNAVSYVAPVVALLLMREREMVPATGRSASGARMLDVLRYIRRRPTMLWTTVLIGVFVMFTNNLPVTLTAYAKYVFHSGAGGYGLLSSVVAVGSLAGGLLSARRTHTSMRGLLLTGVGVCVTYLVAAAAPGQWTFLVVLAAIGVCTLSLVTACNASVQLASHDRLRGRVMGVYLLVFTGSSAVGGPLLGAVDQHLGPRAGMLLSGIVPAVAVVLVAVVLARTRTHRAGRPTTPRDTGRPPRDRGPATPWSRPVRRSRR